jgi:hypothetical protein
MCYAILLLHPKAVDKELKNFIENLHKRAMIMQTKKEKKSHGAY